MVDIYHKFGYLVGDRLADFITVRQKNGKSKGHNSFDYFRYRFIVPRNFLYHV
jgi:hypothetical protein